MFKRSQPPSPNNIEGPENVTPYTRCQAQRLKTLNAAVYGRAIVIAESKRQAGARMTLSDETSANLYLLSAYKDFMGSSPVRRAEHQRGEKTKKFIAYGAVGTAALGIMLLQGGSYSSIESDKPATARSSSVDSDRRAVLDDPVQATIAMRTLGICARELSAQAEFDDWGAAHIPKSAELAERAEQERKAAKLLEAQNVPCAPADNAFRAYDFTVQTSVGMRSASLSRSDITLYSAADWCATREAWKQLHANQESQLQTNALDNFIEIGDQTFSPQNCA